MEKQRCMLAYISESLLGNGMGKLLELKPDLEVITVKIETEASLVKAIHKVEPQVLVIESHCIEKDQGLIGRIMALQEGMRVIVVSIEENSLQVYDHQKVKIKRIDDFISAIYSRTGPLNE